MIAEPGGGPTLTLNPSRIENIFGERQVRVMGELADYVIRHNQLPTTDKLVAFTQRPEAEVRGDLSLVNFEGFLWAFGVVG